MNSTVNTCEERSSTLKLGQKKISRKKETSGKKTKGRKMQKGG